GLATGLIAVIGVISFIVLMRRHLQTREASARAVAESAERLRTTLASIGDAVISTDGDGFITNMNAVAESLTAWPLSDARGRPLTEVFHIVNETTRAPASNPATRALRDGVIVGLANHTVLIARDGTERAIDDSAAPIRCKAGEIVGCVLVFRDITERRQLERDLDARLDAARLLANIVSSSEDAIISKSLDGIIQSWNASAERLFGFTAAEAVGQHISLVIPPDRLDEETEIIASLKAGKRVEHFDTWRQRQDGSQIQVSLTISPVLNDEGAVVGASKLVRDVTRQRQAEYERQRFVTVIENSADFIGMCDLQGIPFYVNRAGLQMVGLDDIEQVRRTHLRDFFFPEDQEQIINTFVPSVLRDGHGEMEVRFRSFRTGEPRWMVYKAFVLTGDENQIIGLATVSQDVTRRREMEDNLRALASDLSEADRRKDEFLATLAHELRNPLAPISNALQILRLSDDPLGREQARLLMERQLEQMIRLVDDLLDVSRITRGKLELRIAPVPLATVINSAIETSQPLIDRMEHELSVSMPADDLRVNADLTRLAQVFANLLNNSAKYMDRGGRIWLTVEEQGDSVVVTVRDEGIGIAPDQLQDIFEMFSQADHSLERAQGGLGIGLTLVKRLVEMHGGEIAAHSDGLGKGATFTIRLPLLAESAAIEVPAADVEDAPSRIGRKVLIVDDNRDSANTMAMLLNILGNETRTAYDGQQGVDTAAEFRPDVMLLDIGLPKLNGYEACRRIREQSWGADIVLIAVTGWGQDEDRRRSQAAGFDHHLVKPLDPQQLSKLLSQLSR
ncbi:MAG: PAS domain S-box protein, partial [Planctomycetaceae bacterium]|nr:PAS domain S-box protein [Planctomycetaceae bacterium]